MTTVDVQLGSLRLPVSTDEQADTPVRWNASTWERHLYQAVPDEAAQLLARLQQLGPLNRQALYDAAGQDLMFAHLAVVVWGVGTSGHFRNIVPRLRRALAAGQSQLLERSRSAAGAPLAELWDAHFGGPTPDGLGSTAYGTKWLHAVGWRATPSGQPGPLVYDDVVWSGLTYCAEYGGYARPRGKQRSSWLAWCELAHEQAGEHGDVTADAMEFALFEHAGSCLTARRGRAQ